MGPMGRVPSNFGDYGDQVYLVPSNFCNNFGYFCWALWEAKFKGEAERVGKWMSETGVGQ